MAYRSIPNPKLQDGDKDIDALSKIAANSGPQPVLVLENGVNNTGVKLSGVLFVTEGMSINSATAVDVTGTLAGKAFPAGFFLPVQFTQIQVQDGFAIGFVHSE